MRKYFETVFVVKVLSEDKPVDVATDLEDLDYLIHDGACVGDVECTAQTELTGKEAADKLAEFGSEPGFFQLDAPMVGLSVLLALAAGFVAGAYPAWRTCQLPPALHLKVS